MNLVLRFSAQNLPASLFIRLFRWIPFSHVEAVMSDNRTYGARILGGVQVRKAPKYARLVDLTVDVPEALWIEALSMRGWSYDILALFAFLFRIKMNKGNAVTCVEMWTTLLDKYGIIEVPDTRIIDPYQLYLILININKRDKHGTQY
jgi:hypothetical protein